MLAYVLNKTNMKLKFNIYITEFNKGYEYQQLVGWKQQEIVSKTIQQGGVGFWWTNEEQGSSTLYF